MSRKLFGRSKRRRNWGRSMRIDSWERLQLVVELMKSSLPIHLSMDLNHSEVPERLSQPTNYDPRSENSMMIPVPLPVLAEVRVSLSIDETFGWLLPVQFCIDQLLTAEEVVSKLADAFLFLEAWSQVHVNGCDLRTQRFQEKRAARPAIKYMVQ